ncbi:DUF1345 domain-containing protein [Kribbella italica]|uniref:DUF1345 domain-containing protein n=1 Tax=Kribbella italica TaxID=1540520 RepID=A0A7W9MUA0_9ACTN|nr:DUF1345 domain-containing protein [Kribbella italica]MBB5835743.1 hypothetical protein [Kribbella italica]
MPTVPSDGRPRLVSDGSRYVVAAAVSVALAAGYGSLVQIWTPGTIGSLEFLVTVYFGTWSAYATIYMCLTWAVLRPAGGAELRRWLAESQENRRRRRRSEWWSGGGPLGALSFCLLAIGSVAAAAVLPELRSSPTVIGLAVLVVASSWLLIVTVYTVHYAREDAHRGGLRFAGLGESKPRLSDYWYLAVQVGTAYNGADVAVSSPAMRKTVAQHALVAFLFNSILIALLVSLLVA